jgi:hypothetical protein
MKYFLDTEFLEGTQDQRFLGFKLEKVLKYITGILLTPLIFYVSQISYLLLIPISIIYAAACFFIDKLKFNTKNTIDLISIGIVSEDSREFYEVSKDFNLKEAWNRFQIDEIWQDGIGTQKKTYWIRDNVLLPIYKELHNKSMDDKDFIKNHLYSYARPFSYSQLNVLINWYGKTNKQIANEIVEFVYGESDNLDGLSPLQESQKYEHYDKSKTPEFYAYFADYDWVVFCWLFGKMIDLPKGFPKYCKDLKQMLDNKAKNYDDRFMNGSEIFKTKLSYIKNKSTYPIQDKETQHNALDDAKWDLKLYNFLKSLN